VVEQREDNQLKRLAQEAWQWLERELDNWSNQEQSACFWWRDDDAGAASNQLTKLLGMTHTFKAPLALAVIPAKLEPGLVDSLRDQSLTTVLQHGFDHQSHAKTGQRKLELGGTRSTPEIIADLDKGFQRLHQAFGDRFTPVLVPPWNRIDRSLLACLPAQGFAGVSTMKVRRTAHPAPGLLQVNTHLDPVNWRHRGGFIGVYPAIAILVQHLRSKRLGYRDHDEPTGILSHHLVQNDAVWHFLGDLLEFLSHHPAVTWQSSSDIWK
jgi:hypothetical protein